MLIDAARPGAYRPDAPPLAVVSEPLGVATNNVAEYVALVLALERAEALGAGEVELLLDSKLIVEQLHGRYRVRDVKLAPLHAEARARLGRFGRWSAALALRRVGARRPLGRRRGTIGAASRPDDRASREGREESPSSTTQGSG